MMNPIDEGILTALGLPFPDLPKVGDVIRLAWGVPGDTPEIKMFEAIVIARGRNGDEVQIELSSPCFPFQTSVSPERPKILTYTNQEQGIRYAGYPAGFKVIGRIALFQEGIVLEVGP